MREAKNDGLVMMVGDEVNDAPALAEADVTVAFSSPSSSVAAHTAQILVVNNQINRIPAIIESGRVLRGTINNNLFWGLIFVILSAILSALGILSPVMAALVHEAGAFSVLFNSIRLLKYKPSYINE